MAKVTDYIVMVGKRTDIEVFLEALGRRFPISTSVVDDTIRLNGCIIRQEPIGHIDLCKKQYEKQAYYIYLTRQRRKQSD